MNMPGFTADTSLYKAGRSYRMCVNRQCFDFAGGAAIS